MKKIDSLWFGLLTVATDEVTMVEPAKGR